MTMSGGTNGAPVTGQDSSDVVEQALARHAGTPGALLPIFHAIQDRLGYIPPESLHHIAQTLNISRAEVHGVLTFYHDFRTSLPGRHIVRLCRAEACQAMGGEALAQHARSQLGVDFRQTRADGAVTLEPVYCLGNCACAPAMLVDGRLFGRVVPDRFDEIMGETLREGQSA
jgi:formate dehydrogenase subunit gamma